MRFASACNANLYKVVSVFAVVLLPVGLTPAFGQIVREDSSDTSDSDIWKYPTRDLSTILGYQFGIDRLDATSSFRIRGEQPHTVSYVVDGIPLANPDLVNVSTVSEAHISTGYISPRYGDNIGSLIEINTQSTESIKTGFSIEEYTESGSLISGNYLAGQLGFAAGGDDARWKFRLQTSAQIVDDLPSEYSAEPFPVLTREAEEFLRTHPQSHLVNSNGTYDGIPLPRDLPDTLAVDQLCVALNLPTDCSPRIVSSAYALTDSSLTTETQPAQFTRDERLLQLRVRGDYRKLVRLEIGATRRNSEAINYDSMYSVFNPLRYPMTDSEDRRYTYRLAVTPASAFSFNASHSRTASHSTIHDSRVSPDASAMLEVDDWRDPTNAEVSELYRPERIDGAWYYTRGGDYTSTYLLNRLIPQVGVPYSRYSDRRSRSHYTQLSARGQFNDSSLEIGFTSSTTSSRFFQVEPNDLLRLSEIVDDLPVVPQEGVWEDLNGDGRPDYPEIATPFRDARFYGYDANGARTAESTVHDNDLSPIFSSVAPFVSFEKAAYTEYLLQGEKFAIGAGLRIQVNGNDSKELVDPWSYHPTVKVGDVDSLSGGMLPDDLIVYQAGDRPTGYRDSDGNAYDADGSPIPLYELIGHQSYKPVNTFDDYLSEVFKDTDDTIIVLPRFRADFFVGKTTIAFYAGKYARAPVEFQTATYTDYLDADDNGGHGAAPDLLLNAGLSPEVTTQYGLVFTQSGLNAEVYRREMRDHVIIDYAGSRRTWGTGLYMNNGHSSATGLLLAYSRSLGPHASYDLFYNLERVNDTRIPSWPRSNPYVDKEIISGPSELQRLHKGGVNVSVTAPADWDVSRPASFLRNSRLAAYFRAGSGIRYSPELYIRNSLSNRFNYPSDYTLSAKPFYKLDLSVSKNIELRRTAVTVFVWVENVLDRTNVNEVYSLSGEPNSDSYYDLRLHENGQVPDEARLIYDTRLFNPDHTGIPRVVRVGLRVHL